MTFAMKTAEGDRDGQSRCADERTTDQLPGIASSERLDGSCSLAFDQVVEDLRFIKGDRTSMKRNPVAWAALIVASAALFSSAGFLRPMPAAPKVTRGGSADGQGLVPGVRGRCRVRAAVGRADQRPEEGWQACLPPRLRRFLTRAAVPGNPGDQGQDLEEMLRKFFGPESGPQKEQFGNRGRGVGSGFVYDNRGHILTNNHVVENSEKITVTFWDGVEAKATLVGTDKRSDVAVIKVDNTSYPPLPKGDSSKLKVGELVMAVGSPFELSQSVTTGIISALERNSVGINEYESFIQTDAAINRGNSGGPLVNMDGEVIGINSAIVSGSSGNDGIGFTIPINMAASVANMLIKDGKVHYARVGIQLAPLTPALARQLGLDEGTKGVLVGDVLPGSPAEKAGLKQGDVIIGFAGEKVQSLPSFRLKVATSEVAKPSRAGLPPRRQGADDFDRARAGRERRLRHGKGRPIRQPEAESQRTREDGDQRLRPRSPAVDLRTGQAARIAGGHEGPGRLLRQGRQPRRGRGDRRR